MKNDEKRGFFKIIALVLWSDRMNNKLVVFWEKFGTFGTKWLKLCIMTIILAVLGTIALYHFFGVALFLLSLGWPLMMLLCATTMYLALGKLERNMNDKK